MNDQKCNGWKNYPTWARFLWLENEERATYKDITEAAVTYSDYIEFLGFVEETLSEDLIGYDLLGASADIFEWAIQQIDYDEIAQMYWYEYADERKAYLTDIGELDEDEEKV